MRALRKATAAAVAGLLFAGPVLAQTKGAEGEKKKPSSAQKPPAVPSLEGVGESLTKGVGRAKEQLAPTVDQAKRGMDRLGEAAAARDEAMNGCTLESRKAYEFNDLGEYYLGRALAAEHLGKLGATDLGPNHPVSQYVNQVGQLLGFAAEALGEQNARERVKSLPEHTLPNRPRPLAGYHFIVLDREEPNAFGGPGGVVMVTTGLLRLLESEDELAAVLSHEIVHVQRGHGVELIKAFMCQQAKQAQLTGPVRDLADQAGRALASMKAQGLTGLSDDALGPIFAWVNEKMQAMIDVGYPRPFELEADRIGLRYMQILGYDPNAMVRVFERLEKASPDEEYGATHPKFEQRVKVVTPVIETIHRQTGKPADTALQKRGERFRTQMAKLPKAAAKSASAN